MKSTFLARKTQFTASLLTLFAMFVVASASVAVPTPAQPWPLYQGISRTFWSAEHQLEKRTEPFPGGHDPYRSPLDKTDPLYQKYFYVDTATDKYLQLLDEQEITKSWTLPSVLYLGGIAAFTIGDYANAEKYFSILLRDFGQYQRDHYISENFFPDPDFSEPVKPGVSKLLFYCQIRGSGVSPEKVLSPTGETPEPRIAKPRDSFNAFQQFNQTALKVLLSQQEFAKWLANRPYRSQRDVFLNEEYGYSQPDKARASMLPRMPQLIQGGWGDLFPAALKKSGASKMRDYLRELIKPDSLLKEMAMPRLMEVDQLVIKHYFAQAKSLLRKHNFAATRKMYSKIISEYSGTDAAHKAEIELQNVTPISVRYFKKEGDKNWNPVGHMGVPQDKAMKFYESMYKADPDGPQADYALFYWARGLGTVGKVKEDIKLLEQHLVKFPKSKLRSAVMYELGFAYANLPISNHKKGIKIFAEVARLYPHSEQAPEAIWHQAFLYSVDQHFDKAIPLLLQLKAQYPKSKRTQWVDAWVAKYQKVLKGEDEWP